ADPTSAVWLLDQPVSNSGRLAQSIREMAGEHTWALSVRLVLDPDKGIRKPGKISVTSDYDIPDRVKRWFDHGEDAIATALPPASMLDVSDSTTNPPLA